MLTVPKREYPRPQFSREPWLNLNGLWGFDFDDENVGEQQGWFNGEHLQKSIVVPFTYETAASGIDDTSIHPYVWYQRKFKLPAEFNGKKVLLNFQAVDYLAKVWVNGQFVGQHEGGYAAFQFDITPYVDYDGENNLVVKVEDTLSCHQLRGKQGWKAENFRCWYSRTTGIWQTVWLECVNGYAHIRHVKMTPDVDSGSITFEYFLALPHLHSGYELVATIKFGDELVNKLCVPVTDSYQRYSVRILSDFVHERTERWWTPETPHLYDVSFELRHKGECVDFVESYFGMRKIHIRNGKVFLNNRPLYQKLVLDQGYWPDTLVTAPSDEALIKDIELTKAMGFNGVRKHQKVEEQRYLYWCDKMGLLVWSEIGAFYQFSDISIDSFTREWLEVVQQYYNHPSIITWTPFNESWGLTDIPTDRKQQQFTEAIYHLTKSIDQTRPVIVNDGWEHTCSDIITIHDYVQDAEILKARYEDKDYVLQNPVCRNNTKFVFAENYEYRGQPIQISEFGGTALESGREGWGYGDHARSQEEWLRRLDSLVTAIREIGYISGFCYTQLTDVQQEINGLLEFDRSPKADIGEIRKIFGKGD